MNTMKTTASFTVIAGAYAAMMMMSVLPGNAGKGKNGRGEKPATTLTETEAATLTFMREEEKLARDVYLMLADLWGNQIFSNIAASEQKHMDAPKSMLDKYNLPDPVLEEGEFADPELQHLYDRLVVNPHFPALRDGPTAVSGASRKKQFPSSNAFAEKIVRVIK